jgi:Na+/proline symporter
MNPDQIALIIGVGAMLALSFAVSPRVATSDGFFRGIQANGAAPGLWTLALSQVTTWIFARSLLTAAILAFHYGVPGALAYTAYYLSFFTGGLVIDRLRRHHRTNSIQEFLRHRFGRPGPLCFNIVIVARLLSEVFANLLVVGLIFGAAGGGAYSGAILALSLATLAYSMLGGMSASLRSDVMQMIVFFVILIAVWVATINLGIGDLPEMFSGVVIDDGPGWVLLVVALLQVWSYPLHDPVMTDRGFLADTAVTRRSFHLAGVLSMACILAFAMLGVVAAGHAAPGEGFQVALAAILGPQTLLNGRIAMAACMAGGLLFLFLGSKELYTAVAVSGTASMFLAPVIAFSIFADKRIPGVSYVAAFVAAMAGAVLYFQESSAGTNLVGPFAGVEHKYSKLLVICVAVLATGFAAFGLGAITQGRAAASPRSTT